MCNGYEELGILVKNGIVDKDLFLDRYSWVITGVWRATDKAVADARQDTGQAAIWENFEYLAVLSKELDSKPSERLSERYGEDALTRAAAAEKPLKVEGRQDSGRVNLNRPLLCNRRNASMAGGGGPMPARFAMSRRACKH